MRKDKFIDSSNISVIKDFLAKGDILSAQKLIFNYLKVCPNDSLLVHLLVVSYIKSGQYDMAFSILNDDAIMKDKRLVFDLMSLYIKLGMRENIEKVYSEYFKSMDLDNIYVGGVFSEINRDQMFTYLNKNFDYNLPIKNNNLTSIKMLDCYIENAAIAKLEKDHCEENSKSLFKVKDISRLYSNVRKYIDNNIEDGVLQLPVFDEYLFHLDDCGMVGDRSTDYFRVITIINTSNIVTMQPVLYTRYRKYNELEEKKVCDMGKAKVKTGMERFNARYGNNF